VIADRAEALADFIGQAGKFDQRADQAIVARRHLKPVLAPEVDQGFPRGFAHRGVVHLLRINPMLTREKIKIARIRKSMGIRAKATREKIRADLNQKREELRAQLDALPANATGQRDKIAFEIAALTRLLCNPLVNEPRAHLRARMLVLRRQFVPLLPTR
jgi:DNA-binding transcriptional MerR regulator